MKKYQFLAWVLTLGFLYGCGSGTGENTAAESQSATNQNQNAQDQNTQEEEGAEFLKEAAQGGMLEVRLGELAQQQASMQQVKDFGQRMVTDHGRANQELKALASEKNITVPDSLSDEGRQHVEKLSQLSGQEFDQQYMDMMVKEHEKDIDKFQQASENVTDTAIQNFASKTLPVLRQHRQLADSINQQVQNM